MSMALGPIANGQNSCRRSLARRRDQAFSTSVVEPHAFHVSNDPTSSDFGQPLLARAGVTAREPLFRPTEDQSIKFDFEAVELGIDQSRLEIDFANASGTDPDDFLLIRMSTSTGLRIAVNKPLATGDWTSNDFDHLHRRPHARQRHRPRRSRTTSKCA